MIPAATTLVIVLYTATTFTAAALFAAVLLPDFFAQRPLAVKISVLYLLGFAALPLALLAAGLLSLSLWYGYVWIGLNLLLAWRFRGRLRTAFARVRTEPRGGIFDYRPLAWLFAAAAGLLLAEHWIQITMTGNIQWDAWAIWGLRARVMHVADGLRGDAFGPKFAYFRAGSSDYPIMVPLGQTWMYHHLGSLDEETVKYTLFFPLLALCVLAADFFRRRFGAAIGWLVVGLLLSMDDFGHYLKVGYMDPVLAIYSVASVFFLVDWIESAAPASLILAGAFAGIAPWIKNDGAFTALALAATVGVVRLRHGRPGWRLLGAFLLADLWFLIAWRVFAKLVGLTSWYGNYLNTNLATYPTYASLLLHAALSYFRQPYWMFALAVIVVSVPFLLRRPFIALWYPIAQLLGTLVLLTAITKNAETLRFYEATNVERILMQAQVPAVVLALYVFFAGLVGGRR